MTKNLDKLSYIYSVDTSCFYSDFEHLIHNKLLKSYRYRDYLKSLQGNFNENKKFINHRISKLKSKLFQSFNENHEMRTLRSDSLKKSNIISIFDSTLTRTLGIKENELSMDLLVVQTYYFQILESIIKNGFLFNGEKYIYFSSSAGQIRCKKSVFLKESLFKKHCNTLMCGLSVGDINNSGGINLTKYQAYLALSNSASYEWSDFDINRCIVVDDLETSVKGTFDHIDNETYEITRKVMDIEINHTDGCGIMLNSVSEKSFMFRMPFFKGLLVPFPFDKFAHQHKSYKVKDIYGVEHDIIKENIQIIFTKSQFKLHNFYKSWDDYKEKFIKYNCQASKLNEEDTSRFGKLNYQMLQSLTDVSDEELFEISKDTIEDIMNISSDKAVMLKVLAATESNNRKNSFQESLFMYPELLNDVHSKQTIKNKKYSLVKEAMAGKLNVNGIYTFICPDLYAACEKWFLGNENPNGLLNDGEVHCRLFEQGKLSVLRSPHLYREWAIRSNITDNEMEKWFITDGIYTSVKDTISRLLQHDCDGDKSLVIKDDLISSIAERNMKNDDIVPLYYEMKKGKPQEINNENLYHSLILAYKANIGEYSNSISKIWNSNNVNLDVIKWLTAENNYEIDRAKTSYFPTRPDHVNDIIKKYLKSKLPSFFIYAKDKDVKNVEVTNNSTVNRLQRIIPNKRINFKKVAGGLDYKMLMSDDKVNLHSEIIERYLYLDSRKKWIGFQKEDTKNHDKLYIYKFIRDELLKIHNDKEYITDVLVKYLYEEKVSKNKTSLWESFGDVIVKNLKANLNVSEECCDCEGRFKVTKQRQVRCDGCQKELNKINARLRKRKQRNSI
jgi:hypothetical protein